MPVNSKDQAWRSDMLARGFNPKLRKAYAAAAPSMTPQQKDAYWEAVYSATKGKAPRPADTVGPHGKEESRGFMENVLDFAQSQGTRFNEQGFLPHMKNVAAQMLSGGILPPAQFKYENQLKTMKEKGQLLKVVPSKYGGFDIYQKGKLIGHNERRDLVPGWTLYDPKTGKAAPVKDVDRYLKMVNVGEIGEDVAASIPSLGASSVLAAPKTFGKLVARTAALGAAQGGIRGGLEARQEGGDVLRGALSGAAGGAALGAGIPIVGKGFGIAAKGVIGLGNRAINKVTGLSDDIAVALKKTITKDLPLDERLAAVDDLLMKTPDLRRRGALTAIQEKALLARRNELFAARANELMGKALNKSADPLERVEAHRKLSEGFRGVFGDDELDAVMGRIQGDVKAAKAAQEAAALRGIPLEMPRPGSAREPAAKTEIIGMTDLGQPITREIPVSAADTVEPGLLQPGRIGPEPSKPAMTPEQEAAAIRNMKRAFERKGTVEGMGEIKIPLSAKQERQMGKLRGLQAAPAATAGAYGNVHALELEAEADRIEGEDPERAASLRKEAALWRAGGTAALAGAGVGSLKLLQKPAGRIALQAVDEVEERLPSLFKDLPEARIGARQIELGDVRGGVMTLMNTEGVPPGLKEVLADLVEAGDERVIKQTVSNAERMDQAAARIARFGDMSDPANAQAAALGFLDKASKGRKGGATDTVERVFLIKQLNKHAISGDVDPAMKQELLDTTLDLATEHFEKGSKAAKELQVYTLMRRMSPEGLVAWGQKIADRAGARLRPETVETILEAARRFQAGDVNAMAQIKAAIQRDIPAGPWEKLAAWRYMAMLSNPSTHLKNLFGNTGLAATRKAEQGIAAGIDSGLSLVTGRRAVMAPTLKEGSQAFAKGLKAGAKRAVAGEENPLMSGLVEFGDAGAVSKYGDISQGRKPMFEGTRLAPVEKAINLGLQAPDEAAFMGAYTNSLINDIQAAAANRGESWRPPPDFVDRLMPGGNLDAKALQEMVPFDVPAWMFDNAEQAARVATLKDENALSRLTYAIRDTLSPIGFGVSGARRTGKIGLNATAEEIARAPKDFNLGQLIMPFAQVPANLTMRALERTPPGSLINSAKAIAAMRQAVQAGDEGAAQMAQRRLAEALAQGATGGATIGIGALLYQTGLMRPTDENRELEELNTREGRIAGGVNLSGAERAITALVEGRGGDAAMAAAKPQKGDVFVSPEGMDPFQTIAGGVASGMQKARRKGQIGLTDTITSAGEGLAGNIEDRSFMRGMQTLMSRGGIGPGIADTIKDVGGSFVPRPAGRIAMAMSGSPVNKKGMGVLEEIGAGVAQNIPGLRDTLPVQLDPLGDEKRYSQPENPALAAAAGLVNPFRVDTYKGTPEGELAIRLKEQEIAAVQEGLKFQGMTFPITADIYRELEDEKKRITGEVMRQYVGAQPSPELKNAIEADVNALYEGVKADMIKKYNLEPVK